MSYIVKQCTLYKYADDNIVSYSHKELIVLKQVLEKNKV